MPSNYGPIITSADVEDAVRATLQRWLDTMLGEIERRSDGRWALREIERPRSWTLVTDYNAPNAERRLPCIAIEAGPEAFTYTGDGTVNSETAINLIVIAKGQTRDKTRETLAALVTAVLQVLWKHGDMDGFAAGTVIGELSRDTINADKAKTVAGARIPIAVLVSAVASKRGGPSVPDPPDVPLPGESPEWPEHVETNVTVTVE